MEDFDHVPKHLIRLAIFIESIRNNCFYGRISVKYNKSSLLPGSVDEIVTTKPPLEVIKVSKEEICFQAITASIEKPMDTAELTELLNNQKLELQVVHTEKNGNEKVIGTVSLELAALKDIKFVKTDDSYIRIYDSFYPIICNDTGEDQGELRVKLYLEDCGPYDQIINNQNEKNDILKNLTTKTDLELKAITQTKRPIISEDTNNIDFGKFNKKN